MENNTMSPQISVIVPIFKTKPYIEKCLDSLINQTFRDIEIICVDDCCPDYSSQYVNKIKKNDARIKLIRHPWNKGSGGARNTGILNSSARLLAFVDSDDFIEYEMLEKRYAKSLEKNFDIVACGWAQVDTQDRILNRRPLKHPQLLAGHFFDKVSQHYNIFNITNVACWNKLWKKSLFLQNKIFFPENVFYEDLATTPRLVFKASSIVTLEEDYYRYRNNPNSYTNTITAKHILEPIREVLESDESDVIPCWVLDSRWSARCGHLNTAWRRSAAAFVTRAI